MAALSFYQPCRSHLAQPARCYDDDTTPRSLQYRRRQFLQKCYEAQSNRREPIPSEISVKRTREELSRNASQTATPTRRLNVDSGWSKVEQVRKKFENAAAGNFSRSFESPPRRRLADSIFASFKLPRKKEPMMRATGQQPKRKSAVELLAESKAFYVKSETVLDRKQELPLRVSSGLSQAIAAGGCHLVSSGTSNDPYCNPYGTTRTMCGSRRAVSAGDGLQNTLRRLLDHTDSRDDVYSPPVYAVPHKPQKDSRRSKEHYSRSGTTSGNSSSGTSGSKPNRSPESKLNRPRSFDSRIFYPDTKVVTRQDSHAPCSIPSPQSPNDATDMTDSIGMLSPPAEYALTAPRYMRSNSHCQPSMDSEESNPNINSHKSLPDLHTHARTYTEHCPSIAQDSYRSPRRRRRNSSHQRTASCSSKGTRSNHSSLMSSSDVFSEHPSPGDENYTYNSRCGWSYPRDSGGSSGHFTQRNSQPQGCPDWVVVAPVGFRDGAPPLSPNALDKNHQHKVTIHFQARAPPPQFQDDVPVYDKYDSYKKVPKNISHTKEYISRYSKPEPMTDLTKYQDQRDTQEYVNTTQLNSPEEITSPLGTFTRQRCFRYKNTKPKPILRSKSDVSDRYRRTEGRSPLSAPCEASSTSSLSTSSLEQFFNRLGLTPAQYEAYIAPRPPSHSPVLFSSCSTIDSNQMHDYTVQGPPQQAPYRNTEPLSIVERNARIIKWLCNCKKEMQEFNNPV